MPVPDKAPALNFLAPAVKRSCRVHILHRDRNAAQRNAVRWDTLTDGRDPPARMGRPQVRLERPHGHAAAPAVWAGAVRRPDRAVLIVEGEGRRRRKRTRRRPILPASRGWAVRRPSSTSSSRTFAAGASGSGLTPTPSETSTARDPPDAQTAWIQGDGAAGGTDRHARRVGRAVRIYARRAARHLGTAPTRSRTAGRRGRWSNCSTVGPRSGAPRN